MFLVIENGKLGISQKHLEKKNVFCKLKEQTSSGVEL